MTGVITPALEAFLTFGLGAQFATTVLDMDPFNTAEYTIDILAEP